jgi:thymidine kinase
MIHSTPHLELIIGCMFSGKSTELIHRIRAYRLINKRFLVINHHADTRYGTNQVISHNRDQEAAVALEKLADLPADLYEAADVVFIDEGQFFADLFDFAVKAVEQDQKTVIVSALDGDYRRAPFDQVVRLIPYADRIDRRTALCGICCDGTVAPFTKRLVSSEERELVGGSDQYVAVCRKCYMSA